MIDWHCHLLPGVDDGSENLDESLAMGRFLVEVGFTDVCCTPHCLYGAYDNTPEMVQQATAALQKEFRKHNISLQLHPGMEYYLDEMFLRNLDHLQPLGDTRLVLVEAPNQAQPEILKDTLFQLLRRKWVPVMAHPERCPLFDTVSPGEGSKVFGWLRKLWPSRKNSSSTGSPSKQNLVNILSQMGCRFQGNIPSFGGFYGRAVSQQAHAHLAAGVYSFFGTDGHSPRAMKRALSQGLEVIDAAGGKVRDIGQRPEAQGQR